MARSNGIVIRGAYRRTAAVLASPWLRVAGTIAGIGVLIHTVDIPKAAASLGHADVRWIVAALALTSVAVLASVMEWGVLIRTVRPIAAAAPAGLLGWRRLGSQYLQSLFFTQVLPAGVGGDALRAVEVGKVTGHGHALASLAGSRMAGTLGMAAWGVAGAVLLRAWLGPVGVIGACVFVVAMVIAWVMALGADRVVRRLHGAECRWRKRVFSVLHPFTGAFRGYRRRPHVLAQCLAVGAAGWGINLLSLAFFARALGINAEWSMFAVAIPVTLLATLAPFSMNGLGLREGVLVGLLAHAGVSSANAGALAVLIDLQMVPFALFGAVLWMRRRKVRALEAAAGAALEPAVPPLLAAEAAAA